MSSKLLNLYFAIDDHFSADKKGIQYNPKNWQKVKSAYLEMKKLIEENEDEILVD